MIEAMLKRLQKLEKLLTSITKRSILDVAAALDPPLNLKSFRIPGGSRLYYVRSKYSL